MDSNRLGQPLAYIVFGHDIVTHCMYAVEFCHEFCTVRGEFHFLFASVRHTSYIGILASHSNIFTFDRPGSLDLLVR